MTDVAELQRIARSMEAAEEPIRAHLVSVMCGRCRNRTVARVTSRPSGDLFEHLMDKRSPRLRDDMPAYTFELLAEPGPRPLEVDCPQHQAAREVSRQELIEACGQARHKGAVVRVFA